jgi:hypothetical protein
MQLRLLVFCRFGERLGIHAVAFISVNGAEAICSRWFRCETCIRIFVWHILHISMFCSIAWSKGVPQNVCTKMKLNNLPVTEIMKYFLDKKYKQEMCTFLFALIYHGIS